jgi:excinuclease ABC subunit A
VKSSGYARVRVDGSVVTVEEALGESLDRQRRHTIEIVVDRYFLDNNPDKPRLIDSLETAARHGEGLVVVADAASKQDWLFSENFSCHDCCFNLSAVETSDFSFNSPNARGVCGMHGVGDEERGGP